MSDKWITDGQQGLRQWALLGKEITPQICHAVSIVAHIAVVARAVGIEGAAQLELVVCWQHAQRHCRFSPELNNVVHELAMLCTAHGSKWWPLSLQRQVV